MAEYTKLDSQQTKWILAQYPLGTLLSTKLLTGGSENTNYRLHTSVGDFVLTLSEQKNLQDAQQLADLLAHLDQNHFTTSKVISNNEGELVSACTERGVFGELCKTQKYCFAVIA